MHTTKRMTMIIFASQNQQAIIMEIQSVCWRSMTKVKDNSFYEQIRPNNTTQRHPKCWLFCAWSKFGLPPELSAKESKAECSERARRVGQAHTSSHMCGRNEQSSNSKQAYISTLPAVLLESEQQSWFLPQCCKPTWASVISALHSSRCYILTLPWFV